MAPAARVPSAHSWPARSVKAFPNVADEIKLVTNGRGAMPSWKGDLTPEQIRQVVEYTRTALGK